MNTKNITIVILALILIGAVGFMLSKSNDATVMVVETPSGDGTDTSTVIEDNSTTSDTEQIEETVKARGDKSVIGSSVDGNDITAYHFGSGDTELLFIGGIHGGYSWNTSLLAYELIDYLDTNPDAVPDDVTVTIIPVANPDGLDATVGTTGRFEESDALAVSDDIRTAGRFNANKVDLNRNFDCDWSATSKWQNETVSGGSTAFSEPEAEAIKNYVETYKPTAAVVWFSAEGKVYPSACDTTPSKDSVEMAAAFATAAGYPADAKFDAYTINGDMVNWMAKKNIPAISVLLTNHKSTEWTKNLAGVKAVLAKYAE
ncbi:hypothetical protein H6784_03940 [Candidatus Nomurabacteria bacterium]|nr:hypothetical protein [Candidatus Nomurabacteria bacterium]